MGHSGRKARGKRDGAYFQEERGAGRLRSVVIGSFDAVYTGRADVVGARKTRGWDRVDRQSHVRHRVVGSAVSKDIGPRAFGVSPVCLFDRQPPLQARNRLFPKHK